MRSTSCLILMVVIHFAINITHIAPQTISPSALLLDLDETNNVSQPIRQSDDTWRIDPSDNFNKYKGGYDITNKHYLASTIFTGVYGYVIGVVWLLCGVAFGCFLLATTFCCKSKRKQKGSHSYKQCCLLPIILTTFFTILAIVASGLVLGGNARFHLKAKTVVNILIDTANEASKTIYNTTGAMEDMRISFESSNATTQILAFLNSTSDKLTVEAASLQIQAEKNRRLINKGLKILYILTTLTISLNLVAVIALSVSGLLRLQKALHWLIVVCWFLTVICWFFFGIYFFLEKFSNDTCTALENFKQNPDNSSLISILPCDELLSAKPVLFDVSEGIYSLVNEVNRNISLMRATSYPNLVSVCNPFSAPPEYRYQPENCPKNTIQIGDIPKVLKVFTCSDASNGTCEDGLISSSDFKTVESYTNLIQNVLNAYPGMESLVECHTVKDAFSEILTKHCKPLQKYIRMVWTAMVSLSTIMVALVLVWSVKAQHDKKHQNSTCNIHSNPGSAL